LFAGRGRTTSVTLKAGETYCHRFGAFRHNDIIGKPYGSKIFSTGKKDGFCYILRANFPDLWCCGPLEHLTQIIYPLDISQICFYLELSPGKRVIESGTGSGSLSLGFARCIYPSGRLDTFEFNEERARSVKAHFEFLQLQDVIHSHQRDVINEGFDVPDGCADAVFLDLPSPWKCVKEAHRVLKQKGTFCSFSPCIEQVQKTCDQLRELGFEAPMTVECLLRTHEVTKQQHEPLDFVKARANDREMISTEAVDNVLQKREQPSEPSTSRFSSTIQRYPHEIPISSRPTAEIRGHTSYLTFSRK